MKKAVKNIDEAKAVLKEHKAEVVTKYHVCEIGIFGSFAQGEQKRRSDIDILVEFASKDIPGLLKLIEMEIYLEKLFQKESRCGHQKRHSSGTQKKHIKRSYLYMTREWAFFVQDIYDAIQHIKEFVGTMNQKEFLADEKTRSAVAFKIENIGEASKNIPRQVKAKYKNLPWAEMARMRDTITHFYFGINYKVVWSVVKKELPALEPAIA